jgi:hypothetical protein
MARRPSPVPNAINEDFIRWLAEPSVKPAGDVIDDVFWESIARDLRLPEEARPELVEIVRWEQGNYRWAKAARREPPSQSRKDLARLHRLAADLANGLALRNMKIDAGIALHRALEEAISTPMNDLHLLYPKFVQDVEKLSDILNRATEIASRREGVSGRDKTLRHLVYRLQLLLVGHTGVGLARASEKSKGRGGRATACISFVSEVSKRVFGEEVSRFTVDDAMKDTIAEHRRGGDFARARE